MSCPTAMATVTVNPRIGRRLRGLLTGAGAVMLTQEGVPPSWAFNQNC
jgi:hypothetical protein